ncbi:MAG: hypothetical protein PVF22_03765 [Candidatus Aminicenantes bacterium]|jgi:hypothetical protein
MSPCIKTKNIGWVVGVAFALSLLVASKGCLFFQSDEPFRCRLVELKKNLKTLYYDAVVEVEHIVLKDPVKSRFYLTTPTRIFELAELAYIEDGADSEMLEPGDVFIVPLQKPDWKFFIREGDEIYCSHDFWGLLPVADQWHPTKSEAMKVAQSLKIEDSGGFLKPAAEFLPVEWEFVVDELPTADYPYGKIVYQKIRGDQIIEEVAVQYTYLTEEEKYDLYLMSETDALKSWITWAENQPTAEMNGRSVVFWDMKGMGSFGWSYRYAYIEDNMVLEVTVNADPLEWQKTELEKAVERRTEKVFLRYGYGPIGKLEWQILIEIRMNREGVFYRRSRTGNTIEKAFKLEEWEFREIDRSLHENRFLLLKSRSGPPGGIDSFLTVQFTDNTHSVEMRDISNPYFENITKTIKGIVLPKIDED